MCSGHITNAIKYAFPGRQSGMIRVLLKGLPDDQVLLEISRLTIQSRDGLVISISFPYSAERPGKFAIHLAENEETVDV